MALQRVEPEDLVMEFSAVLSAMPGLYSGEVLNIE
jgi:hypothetical protein